METTKPPSETVAPQEEKEIVPETAEAPEKTTSAEIAPSMVTETVKQELPPEKPKETLSPTEEKAPETVVPEPEPPAPKTEEKQCTLSVSCASLLNHLDQCDPAKVDIIPANGIILAATTVAFTDGETVFDVLQRVCRTQGIPMEASFSPVYHSAYIEGIANIYEFDAGSGSGWMYAVNGIFPNFSSSAYLLQEGDTVTWVYTCDLGADVGGSNG